MINFFSKFSFVLSQKRRLARKIFRRKYFKNHNISPRDRCYDLKNIFAKKISEKIGVFDSLCKILIITLVFEKNANFFAENRQKSKKIVIITSTPDQFTLCLFVNSFFV
jgi:hypothetical protein